MAPNGLYIAITAAAPVVSYVVSNPGGGGSDTLFNPIGTVLAAVAGAVVGGLTGSAWRGAAIGSGLSIGYQLYENSKQPAALPKKT